MNVPRGTIYKLEIELFCFLLRRRRREVDAAAGTGAPVRMHACTATRHDGGFKKSRYINRMIFYLENQAEFEHRTNFRRRAVELRVS